MKEYDIIAIGSGSATSVVEGMRRNQPSTKAAIVEKDTPGGICLTRGCIPSKILLYSAEIVRTIERAGEFGVDAQIKSVHFDRVMNRMRTLIGTDIAAIQAGLTGTPGIDYYAAVTRFVAPYTMKVGAETIHSTRIVLGLGSEPIIPQIPGLSQAGYLTSDSVIQLQKRPASLVVIGGGYIAAEYGHFFSAMGTKVTIVGRNPQFLPGEDPEIAGIAQRALARSITILTNHEATLVRSGILGKKQVVATDRATDQPMTISADEILVAAGRGPTTSRIDAARGGIALDEKGWVRVNDHLETNQPGIYALGDATGKYPYKHKANYDARIVYYNLVRGESRTVDYHAVPHAVFTDPEVAGVGWTEPEARSLVPPDRLLVGRCRYADTAKGEAMGLHGSEFEVKVLVDGNGNKIVGAHIVGPEASILIQEIVTLLYGSDPSTKPFVEGMHIHPSLSEVVERAFLNLGPADHHHHAG